MASPFFNYENHITQCPAQHESWGKCKVYPVHSVAVPDFQLLLSLLEACMLVIICRSLKIHIHIIGWQRSWRNWNKRQEGFPLGVRPYVDTALCSRKEPCSGAAERTMLKEQVLLSAKIPLCWISTLAALHHIQPQASQSPQELWHQQGLHLALQGQKRKLLLLNFP